MIREKINDAVIAAMLSSHSRADAVAAIEAMGYVIVPKVATAEMIAAAWNGISEEKAMRGIARLGPGPGATDVYDTMIETGKV